MLQLISADFLAKGKGQRGVIYQVDELGGGLYFWGGTAFHGFDAAAATATAPIYVGAWASKPAAAAANAGMAIVITDVGVSGNSVWRSDGAIWRPTHAIRMLEYASEAGVTFAAGAAESRVGSELALPASVFYPGARLRLQTNYAHGTTAEARGVGVKHGATTGAFTSNVNIITTTTTSAHTNADRTAIMASQTVVINMASQSPVGGFVSGAPVVVTIAGLTSPGFLNITATPSAANAITVYSALLTLEP